MNNRLPDWRLGAEHVCQEGTHFWEKMREKFGLSREDVEQKTEELADMPVCWQRQAMFEELVDFPDIQELEALAVIYGTTPGRLLDQCYEETGRALRAEEERAKT